ncbi:tetratricopeptide repeat protein 33 isoform X1 [Alosa sapidissima]|uniref:tetratricopeptide repeat protein 33 isoform X1 n=1 Tax=Alosa sapidissima TaxID=34773 RepID=UPI001C08EAA4|nr:tetratricopeptide repeat protein 33 isoform X1 [Alosa sapidissima]
MEIILDLSPSVEMASFGWKRKVGEKVSKATVEQFEREAEEKKDELEVEGVDWLHAIKRRREILLEDCATRSKRLKDEGTVLAEQGRHWEAIKRWEEAIQLTPEEASLYEMKAQVLSILHEVFPAVQAAEMAAKLRPHWWEAWQTLGRAQLSLGEVELATRSFQVAVHLSPCERPLWEEDLSWARKLRDQKRNAQSVLNQEQEARRLLDNAPELQQDYDDFESDEVIAACTAVAERQKKYEELQRTAVVVAAQSVTIETVREDSDRPPCTSHSDFVKARGL